MKATVNKITIVSVPAHVKSYMSVHWKVRRQQIVDPTTVVCTLTSSGEPCVTLISPGYGRVIALHAEGSMVSPNAELFRFELCAHHVVVKDLCAECGANLRREGGLSGDRIEHTIAKIPMVHAVPELHVSESVAAELALQDEQSLLAARKLVLLVDLDQTVIHTTNLTSAFRYKSVHRFCLPGSPLVYHTRFRPHLFEVLDRLSKCYEMHICTFGNRVYAHQLARMIDPKRRFFSHRILSRDECFNPITKSANLKALFPRGLNLVCIIDDRGEVWDWSPNLVHVKSYRFFPETGDINALLPPPPPPLWRTARDHQVGVRTPSPERDEAAGEETSSVSQETSHASEETSHAGEEVAGANTPATLVSQSDNLLPVTAGTEASQTLSSPVPECSSTSLADDAGDRADTTASPTESAITTDNSTPDRVDTAAGDQLTLSKLTPLVSEQTEKALDDADDKYLLRLQDILLALHRDYFQEYDRWRAHQALSSSPSLSSTSEGGTASASDNQLPSQRLTAASSRLPLPHIADIIARQRTAVLGPDCHVTLSGLAPTHLAADRCLAGRIVRNLGAVLHAGLRLPNADVEAASRRRGLEPGGLPQADERKVDAGRVQSDAATCEVSNEAEKRSDCQTGVETADDHPTGGVKRLPLPAYTSHLIACRRGTEKVRALLEFFEATGRSPLGESSDGSPGGGSPASPAVHLVSPQWLWECHFLWQRVPESSYPLVQDFHPSDFDTEVEPGPGSLRYLKRHRHRHHRHSHHHHRSDEEEQQQQQHPHRQGRRQDSHLSLLQADHRIAFNTTGSGTSRLKHQQHRHSRRHHHRHRHHRQENDQSSRSSSSAGHIEEQIPVSGGENSSGIQLDVSLVRSALDSIRAEHAERRKERRHRKRLAPPEQQQDGVEVTGDGVDSPAPLESTRPVGDASASDQSPCELTENGRTGWKGEFKVEGVPPPPPLQPSLCKRRRLTESVVSGGGGDPVEPVDTNTNSASIVVCQPDPAEAGVIKDIGEQDFEEEEVEGGGDSSSSSSGEDVDGAATSRIDTGKEYKEEEEEDEDEDSQLRQYLPPPRALPLADNPLLHLPPQATTEMLAEIEEAVMEEETERASSVPVEAELYDPADLGLDDDDDDDDGETNSSSKSMSISSTEEGQENWTRPANRRRRTGAVTSRLPANPQLLGMEAERKINRLQVQRELLMRRRRRASPSSLVRIDEKLRRVNAVLNRRSHRLERRSTDDLAVVLGRSASLPDDDDEEEEEHMCYDADYPKGWRPEDHTRRAHHRGYTRGSLSPAIHSDPEPSGLAWSRDVPVEEVEDECKEWNTCPEGYDYADAEQTRRLLSPAVLYHDEAGCPTGRRAGRTFTRCLFGLEEEEEEEDRDDDEEDSVSDDDDDVEGEEEEEEDFTDEAWNPLREFM